MGSPSALRVETTLWPSPELPRPPAAWLSEPVRAADAGILSCLPASQHEVHRSGHPGLPLLTPPRVALTLCHSPLWAILTSPARGGGDRTCRALQRLGAGY